MYYTGCRPLTADEETRFLAALGQGVDPVRDTALGMISLRLGLRLTEILRIEIGHCWQGGKVSDYLTVPRRSVKGRTAGRFLPLRPDVSKAIGDLVEELARRSPVLATPHSYLFAGRFPASRLSRCAGWKIYKRAFRAAGISGGGGTLASHVGRKTLASKVWKKTRDILLLRDVLGHSEARTSERYVQPMRSEVERAFLDT
jgi:integrase